MHKHDATCSPIHNSYPEDRVCAQASINNSEQNHYLAGFYFA